MRKYPNLEINLNKIFENTKEVVNRCNTHNISVTAVTKCVGGLKEVANVFLEAGVYAIGDSRIDNLKELTSINIPKWLIRIPMISEAKETIEFADVSLNSEIKVLESLNYWAEQLHKKHQVILMIDPKKLKNLKI